MVKSAQAVFYHLDWVYRRVIGSHLQLLLSLKFNFLSQGSNSKLENGQDNQTATSNASTHIGKGDDSSLFVGGQDEEHLYDFASESTSPAASETDKRQNLEDTTT